MNIKEYMSLVVKKMFYSKKIYQECDFVNGQLARHTKNPGE